MENLKGHMVQSSQGVWSTKKEKHKKQEIKKVNGKTTIEKENEEEELLPPIQKKNPISGITPSANYKLMIVGDSQLDPEVEMST